VSDLADVQAAQTVKIAGANPSTGIEDNFAEVDSSGRLSAYTPDTTSASTALAALNATVSIATTGLASVGFQILAGTLIGTLTPECSIDGGTTWTTASFYDPVNSTVSNSVVFGSSNTTKILTVLPVGGSSNVRIRVSAYTSGTANAVLRASQVTGAAGAVTAAAFGTVTNNFVSISGNTPTLILAANSNRKYAYISNGSGSVVNIQFGSNTGLSTTTGLIIPAKEKFEIKGDNLFTGNIYAYCAGNITISVTEGTP